MNTISSSIKTALFAGGCFWCIGADLQKVPAVISAVSGYAGGTTESPTYENYAHGGHREVVEVTYNSTKTSYKELVMHFMQSIDPTDAGGSFHDRGKAYSPAIYYETEEEKKTAEKVLKDVETIKIYEKPLAVEVLPRTQFWPAEAYHQDYDKKNPEHYALYRNASGRDEFVQAHRKENWKEKLTPEAYKVLREKGTEPAFSGKLLHEEREGMYRCAACGNPLFPSDAKFDSGTGWPSFDKALPGAVREIRDSSHGMERVEIVCANCGSHLGHVFDDGPTPTGKRYCMNSVCLGFDPLDQIHRQ